MSIQIVLNENDKLSTIRAIYTELFEKREKLVFNYFTTAAFCGKTVTDIGETIKRITGYYNPTISAVVRKIQGEKSRLEAEQKLPKLDDFLKEESKVKLLILLSTPKMKTQFDHLEQIKAISTIVTEQRLKSLDNDDDLATFINKLIPIVISSVGQLFTQEFVTWFFNRDGNGIKQLYTSQREELNKIIQQSRESTKNWEHVFKRLSDERIPIPQNGKRFDEYSKHFVKIESSAFVQERYSTNTLKINLDDIKRKLPEILRQHFDTIQHTILSDSYNGSDETEILTRLESLLIQKTIPKTIIDPFLEIIKGNVVVISSKLNNIAIHNRESIEKLTLPQYLEKNKIIIDSISANYTIDILQKLLADIGLKTENLDEELYEHLLQNPTLFDIYREQLLPIQWKYYAQRLDIELERFVSILRTLVSLEIPLNVITTIIQDHYKISFYFPLDQWGLEFLYKAKIEEEKESDKIDLRREYDNYIDKRRRLNRFETIEGEILKTETLNKETREKLYEEELKKRNIEEEIRKIKIKRRRKSEEKLEKLDKNLFKYYIDKVFLSFLKKILECIQSSLPGVDLETFSKIVVKFIILCLYLKIDFNIFIRDIITLNFKELKNCLSKHLKSIQDAFYSIKESNILDWNGIFRDGLQLELSDVLKLDEVQHERFRRVILKQLQNEGRAIKLRFIDKLASDQQGSVLNIKEIRNQYLEYFDDNDEQIGQHVRSLTPLFVAKKGGTKTRKKISKTNRKKTLHK